MKREKKRILVIFFILIKSSIYSAESQSLPKLFPFKSAIIEYEVVYWSETMKVSRIFYIEEYGKKLCIDEKIFNRKKKHFIYILREEMSYAINMSMRYAAKRKIPPELFDDEALRDWFIEVLYGNRKESIVKPENFEGIERILDYECNIYKHGDEKYWVWNNLILKWEKSHKWIQNPKKLLLDVNIPSKQFEVPKGVFVFPKIF